MRNQRNGRAICSRTGAGSNPSLCSLGYSTNKTAERFYYCIDRENHAASTERGERLTRHRTSHFILVYLADYVQVKQSSLFIWRGDASFRFVFFVFDILITVLGNSGGPEQPAGKHLREGAPCIDFSLSLEASLCLSAGFSCLHPARRGLLRSWPASFWALTLRGFLCRGSLRSACLDGLYFWYLYLM